MDFKPHPIYEFPPFFTRQPNEDTWHAQLDRWHAVIQAFCAHESSWQVSPTSHIFKNNRIQREASRSLAEAILEDMVKKGAAEKVQGSMVHVYAQRPAELAVRLRKWAESTGHGGSVLTFYELTEGELPGLSEFTGLDSHLMKRVVEIMIKKGDAAAIKEDGEMVGLKLATKL